MSGGTNGGQGIDAAFGLPADLLSRFGLRPAAARLTHFAPYIYLDGHRSGGPDDENPYREGVAFALRLLAIARTAGVRDIVFLVSTERNAGDPDRMAALEAAIRDGISSAADVERVRMVRYGVGTKPKATASLDRVLAANDVDGACTAHVLDRYSEEWAADDSRRLAGLPAVSAVVRFTKAHLGGGWLPTKMNRSAFVYCQTPSRSQDWSDDGIALLLAVMSHSASCLDPTIGTRVYQGAQRQEIHETRDVQLAMPVRRFALNPQLTRVISFDPLGPTIYEF